MDEKAPAGVFKSSKQQLFDRAFAQTCCSCLVYGQSEEV